MENPIVRSKTFHLASVISLQVRLVVKKELTLHYYMQDHTFDQNKNEAISSLWMKE